MWTASRLVATQDGGIHIPASDGAAPSSSSGGGGGSSSAGAIVGGIIGGPAAGLLLVLRECFVIFWVFACGSQTDVSNHICQPALIFWHHAAVDTSQALHICTGGRESGDDACASSAMRLWECETQHVHLQPLLTPAASPCTAVVLFLCHRARRRRSEAPIAVDHGGIRGGGSPEAVYVRQVLIRNRARNRLWVLYNK